MPSKQSSSTSKDLIHFGPREVFKHSDIAKERLKRPQRETTTRALVLRNGKYGARGTGEVMLARRMTGREKLDLLAEDLVEKSNKAILRPFRLEECVKIAESQCDVYVDDIANLRGADFFYHIIEAELVARNAPNRETIRKNPSYVAKVVATRLHNSYMLASAWKIVAATLRGFAMIGIRDENIKNKLQNDSILREQYLVLYDVVNTLVDLSQRRFSVLATTAPHYSKFFKLRPTEGTDPGEAEYIFDWTDLRQATSSFIDSIIIELCFPRGNYPETVLYQLLHDAITEFPKDAKRFPQALWDAVGDLSVSVELKGLLDVPLFGPEGEEWKNQPRQMTHEYKEWIDAQFHSGKASDMFANFKDVIFPLEKTMKQPNLDKLWKIINSNYRNVSGRDIDELWKLTENFNYAPQWTSHFLPGLAQDKTQSENIVGSKLALNKRKDNKKKLKERLRIANGAHDSTDSDMPPLQSLSGTDDPDDDDDDSALDEDDEDDDDEDDDDDDEGGYNSDEEDEFRELMKEAIHAAHEADYFFNSDLLEEMNPFEQEDRKGNPFLKLLGSLRGRMFSSSPKLKVEPQGVPKAPFMRMPKADPSSAPLKPSSLSSTMADKAPGDETPKKSYSATVEDASDEEDHVASPTKKKKKKKNKKKKKSASAQSMQEPVVEPVTSAPVETVVTPPASPKQAFPTSQPAPPKSPVALAPAFMSSTISLPVGKTSAQSGRSYLQSLNHNFEKKIKSRPDHASIFSNSEKGFVSNPTGQKFKDEEEPKTRMKEAKKSWFSKVKKKTNDLMHQLLGKKEKTGEMRWDDFVMLMKDMGFTYVPSTAGSSVRFDPPSKDDPPITFHKGHPDSTLHHIKIKIIAKRLKDHYGWDESDLPI